MLHVSPVRLLDQHGAMSLSLFRVKAALIPHLQIAFWYDPGQLILSSACEMSLGFSTKVQSSEISGQADLFLRKNSLVLVSAQ